MLYKMPPYRSSKIFKTGVFWRLRNHTFDGHISGLEQDRDNLKPLLPTKSPMPYRFLPLPSRSRDHTTSGLAFLAFRGHKNRRKRGPSCFPRSRDMPKVGSMGAPYWGSRRCPRRLRSRRVWRSIQQNKRLRFIGFCQPLIPEAGAQFESENISGCIARRFTKISAIVAVDEPGQWPEDFRYLTKGI